LRGLAGCGIMGHSSRQGWGLTTLNSAADPSRLAVLDMIIGKP